MRKIEKIAAAVKQLFNQYPLLQTIVAEIDRAGGIPLLVGGAVRDILLDRPSKDLDIELYRLSETQAFELLSRFGEVSTVGKSFGVLSLHGMSIDWSLPRSDSPGRKPMVEIDPNLPFVDAMRRRDLTMNAIGINLLTKELIDPFNGENDLKNRVLRTPDAQFFVQDPLRFYRVMQFIGRFEMTPDTQLNEICRTMSLADVSRERIEQEFYKLFLQSRAPSAGIRWIASIGRLAELFPEIDALRTVLQNEEYHPEGDVFEHTMQTIDAGAFIARERNYESETSLKLLFAALCHDLGKTGEQENSYGHEITGVPLAQTLLKKITRAEQIIDAVKKLVRHHLVPFLFVEQGAKAGAYKRLAHNLAPEVTIELLADLALADKRGRNAHSHDPLLIEFPELKTFVAQATGARVLQRAEEPILRGRDIMDLVPPGREMGILLQKAYDLQLEQGIVDKERLKALLRQFIEKSTDRKKL